MEKVTEYKKKKIEKMLPKVGNLDTQGEYLSKITKIYSVIIEEFQADCTKITYAHKFGLEYLKYLLEKVYFPKCQVALAELRENLDSSVLIEISKLFSYFCATIKSLLIQVFGIDEKEAAEFEVFLATYASQIIKNLIPSMLVLLDKAANNYIEILKAPLTSIKKARENIKKEKVITGEKAQLTNISLDPRINNFEEVYHINPEIKEEMYERRSVGPAFGKDTSHIEMDQSSASAQKLLLIRKDEEISNPHQTSSGKDKHQPTNKVDSVYEQEFLDYSPKASIPILKENRLPKWIENYYQQNPIFQAFNKSDISMLESLLPIRMSSACLEFSNQIDQISEGIIGILKFIKYRDESIQNFLKRLITIIEKIQEQIIEYLKEKHSNSILFFCDWIFICYRMYHYINYLSTCGMLESEEKIEAGYTINKDIVQGMNLLLSYFEKNYLNEFFMFILPSIDDQEWNSFRPFASSEIRQEEITTIQEKLQKLSVINNDQYIRNINYGLRMWKSNLQTIIGELKFFFSENFENIIQLRIFCHVITETISCIYIRYKSIHPSRIRNPQYLNDMKFFLDNVFHYTKIIYGLTILHYNREEKDYTNSQTPTKFYLDGVVFFMWKMVKALKSHIALMELDYNVIAAFLKDCLEGTIKLPHSITEDQESVLEMVEYIKRRGVDYFQSLSVSATAKTIDNDQPELLKEMSSKLIQKTNVTLLHNGEFYLNFVSEKLHRLCSYKDQYPLSRLYEMFDTLLDSQYANDEKVYTPSVSSLVMNKTIPNESGANTNQSRTSILATQTLIKEISDLLKVPNNPLLKYSQNSFLVYKEIYDEKALRACLRTIPLTPDHILFVIKKRIEYTFDKYPQLTDDNKKAQKTLNPVLRDFCAAYNLHMIPVPIDLCHNNDIRGKNFVSTKEYNPSDLRNSSQKDCFWKDEIIIRPKDEANMHVFVVQKIHCADCSEITLEIIEILREHKCFIYMDKKNLEELQEQAPKDYNLKDIKEFNSQNEMTIDLLVVVGGDGSILWALMHFKNRVPPPVVGFGKGTVGYLCNFNLDQYKKDIKRIMEHIEKGQPLRIEKKDRIHVEIVNKKKGVSMPLESLNEIVIERGCNPHVIQVDTYVEGKFLTSFQGDGLIISTPTGSTAYSLAAGGPIINHLLPSLTMTPICSIKVTSKPLVVSPNLNMTYKLGPNSRNGAYLCVDGQIQKYMSEDLTIMFHVIIVILFAERIVLLGDNQDALDNWIDNLRHLLGSKMSVAQFNQEKATLVKL